MHAYIIIKETTANKAPKSDSRNIYQAWMANFMNVSPANLPANATEAGRGVLPFYLTLGTKKTPLNVLFPSSFAPIYPYSVA